MLPDFQWTETPVDTALYVILPFALFLIWRIAKWAGGIIASISTSKALGTIVTLLLWIAGAWCFGTTAEIIRMRVEPDLTVSRQGLLLGLAEHIAFAVSFAKVIEISLEKRERRAGGTELSELSIGALYFLSIYAAVLIYLATNDYPELTLVASAFAGLMAFAVRQTLTDMIAGIALSIERPFRRRDWVRLEDGTDAEVMNTDWRATRFRGWDRAIFTVPNSSLARQRIQVLPKSGELYAETVTVLVSGEQDPKLVNSLLEKAASQSEAVMTRPAPSIRLNNASTVPYEYALWVHYNSYNESFSARAQLLYAIHVAFREAGIQIMPELRDVRYTQQGGKRGKKFAAGLNEQNLEAISSTRPQND